MSDDSKALPEITITPRDIPTEAQPSLVYSVPGEYDDEFLPMTEEHLTAVLAAMDSEQRQRVVTGVLESMAPEQRAVFLSEVSCRLLDLSEKVVTHLNANLAAERAKVVAYESFWREHGEVVTHCPGHHAQLVRDANRLLGVPPLPCEVFEELQAERASHSNTSNILEAEMRRAEEARSKLRVAQHGHDGTRHELERTRATLAKVEAERAHYREAAELMRLARSTPGWHDRALAWRTKDEGTRQ